MKSNINYILILLPILLLILSPAPCRDKNHLSILKNNEPALRQRAEEVTEWNEDLYTLVSGMKNLLKNEKRGALAANQTGYLKRIFVIKWQDKKRKSFFYVFINPVITESSPVTDFADEKCLSFPGMVKKIERPVSINVMAWNENQHSFTLSAEGLLARVIQHEIDHLNGIVIADKQ